MAGSCDQELEASSSDDDSVSLLCDLNACQSRGAAEDVEISDLDSQVGNKEQKRQLEMEINQLKAPESGISSCTQSAAYCANSPSHLAADVLQRVRIPSKTHLNKRNGKGETHLHKACERDNLARVRALIQAGVCVNVKDNAGWTALHEACIVGDEAVVEELLKAGANVNARSFDGVTPLHDAVCAGHYQAAKLLLQYGSNASDRNLGGLSALDMAEEENIKELLLTFQASSDVHEQPCETPADLRPAGLRRRILSGDTSSEAHRDAAKPQSRESGDGDGAREPGDIQPREKDTAAANVRALYTQLSDSEAITAVLEEVARKQAEISRPLEGLEDAGHVAALTDIHNVLEEVLAKQCLEKDHLAKKCRTVSGRLRPHVLKSQLVSLASCQRTLVEILKEQMHLVRAATKAKLPVAAPTPASSTASTAGGQRRRPAAPLPTRRQRGRASSSSRWKRRANVKTTRKNAAKQTRAADNSRDLAKLTQSGVVPPGSALQLRLKGRQHVARVQADGSIQDSKGRRHAAPERWAESILGNNIPVSSTYAWDKVTFRDKPLSSHLPHTEAEENTLHMCGQSSEEQLPTEPDGLTQLMKIKTIQLVGDEELLPNAVLDSYWKKLVERDGPACEDWDWSEFL